MSNTTPQHVLREALSLMGFLALSPAVWFPHGVPWLSEPHNCPGLAIQKELWSLLWNYRIPMWGGAGASFNTVGKMALAIWGTRQLNTPFDWEDTKYSNTKWLAWGLISCCQQSRTQVQWFLTSVRTFLSQIPSNVIKIQSIEQFI